MENTIYIVRVAESEWDDIMNHSAYMDKDRAEQAAADLRRVERSDSTFSTFTPRYYFVCVHPVLLL
jgi:hypothetical protein